MSEPNASSVREALNVFLLAPTQGHREKLVAAADDYRELWIEAKSSAQNVTARPLSINREPTTTYDRQIEVRREVDGVPMRLALQERTDEKKGVTWWVLSWRSNLSANGRNRRFYYSDGDYWKLPAVDALDLLEEIDSRGALDERYLDARNRGDFEAVVSDDLSPRERAEHLSRMTAPNEDWGTDPFFVIVGDPNPNWQKVMIVNRITNMATFRSITTDADYKPRKELRPGEGWWLDNSMLDANVQQTRRFLECLKRCLSS